MATPIHDLQKHVLDMITAAGEANRREMNAQVYEYARWGYSVTSIAEHLDVHRSTVHRMIREHEDLLDARLNADEKAYYEARPL